MPALKWENANVVRMHGLQRRVVCCRTYPLPCIWYLISLIPGCQLQQAPSLAIESMHIPLNQEVKNITRSYFRIASLYICNSFYILFLAISVASIKCVVLLMFNIFLFLVNFYFDFFYLYFVLCFVISFPPNSKYATAAIYTLPRGCSSFLMLATCHVFPPSIDTSTRMMPFPPPLYAYLISQLIYIENNC